MSGEGLAESAPEELTAAGVGVEGSGRTTGKSTNAIKYCKIFRIKY